MGTLGQYSVHIIRSTVLAYAFRFRKSGLIKQDRQCRYNVTTRRFRAVIVEIDYKYYIFKAHVCRTRYPAYNAHTPYCRLWLAQLYNNFPHYLLKGTIFEGKKKLYGTKNVFCFSLLFRINIFHSKKYCATYDQKCVLVFM